MEEAEAAVSSADIAAKIGDDDKYVRRTAVEALGKMGPAAAPHASDLCVALRDSDTSVRWMAAVALSKLGPAAAAHAADLVAALRDREDIVKSSAAEALGSIGAAAKPYAGELAKLLHETDYTVRLKAAESLGKCGDAAAPHVSSIVLELQSPSQEVRLRAAETLCDLAGSGSVAPHFAAVATCKKRDRSEAVRDTAGKALGKVGTKISARLRDRVHPGKLKVTVPSTKDRAGDTFFHIEMVVERSLASVDDFVVDNRSANTSSAPQTWAIEKSYTEFAEMHALLVEIGSLGAKDTFPRKHTFGCSGAKLEARTQGLEAYLQVLIACINEDIRIGNVSDFETRLHSFLQKDREARAVLFGFLQFLVLLDSTVASPSAFSMPGASAPGGYPGTPAPIDLGFSAPDASAPP